MNYIILLFILLLLYNLYNLENKAILLLFILLGVYIYYENLLPDTFWEIPKPLYREKFQFGKLDRLISQYNKSSREQDEHLKILIQKEIDTIYFSFPNHLHEKITEYMYSHYGFR